MSIDSINSINSKNTKAPSFFSNYSNIILICLALFFWPIILFFSPAIIAFCVIRYVYNFVKTNIYDYVIAWCTPIIQDISQIMSNIWNIVSLVDDVKQRITTTRIIPSKSKKSNP